MTRPAVVGVLLAAALVACTPNDAADPPGSPTGGAVATLAVTSEAFGEGGQIPAAYTCDGQNVSPPLSWDGVPGEAAELALVVLDPDAPRGTFVHWVVTGIDPGQKGSALGAVPPGAQQHANSFGTRDYGGPCPPKGDPPHTYEFTVFALAEPLGLDADATAQDVLDATGTDRLAVGTLTGRYARS